MFGLRPVVLCLLLPVMLSACGAKSVLAPPEVVSRAAYSNGDPPSITLYTMINNRSGEGGHAALLINGSQRVLFDPAGSWYHRNAPERNDVLFGMTPRMVEIYNDYHARETYHIVMQTFLVSPEVAELALRESQAEGPVPAAYCASSVSSILRKLPGFESVGGGMFPRRLMLQYGELPGVKTVKLFDDDADDNKYKLVQSDAVSP